MIFILEAAVAAIALGFLLPAVADNCAANPQAVVGLLAI